MSGKSRVGNNGGKGNDGISGIPATSKKTIQSLKEIVNNCTEQEIYAILKECNMNPDEAVNRLLSQDTFHEVKSKREKKKENKNTSDSRLHASSDGSIRSSKGFTERSVGLGRSSLSSYPEFEALQSKLPKKENGTHGYLGSSSSAYGLVGNSMNPQASSRRDTVAAEHNMVTSGVVDGITLSSQPSSGHHPVWCGVPGQVSVADIFKRGRLQSKGSVVCNPPIYTGSQSNNVNVSHQTWPPSLEQGIPSQKIPLNDEWPIIEPLPATDVTVTELAAGLEMYSDPSRSALDGANQLLDSEEDKAYGVEDGLLGTIDENANHIRSTSVSGRSIEEDGFGRASVIDSNLYKDLTSYQPHGHGLESKEEEDDVSTVLANLQQLTLQNYGQRSPSEEDNPSLVIPDHLQLHTPDCFHLSFGSFGSGAVAFPVSGSFSSRGLKSNVEEMPVQTDVQSIGHTDTRNSEYYDDGHLRSLDGNLIHRTATSADTYDSPATKPEGLKQEIHEESQADQYLFPSSAPRFHFESNGQSNAQFTHHQMSSQLQNLTNFSNVMQGYSSSLSSSLLASNVQTVRDDYPYSPFPVTQSMPTKYSSNAASSITGPNISMSEALRASSIQNHQPAAQTLPSAGVATGPSLLQHLALHPHSQPTLPLGHFSNMIGYPILPQSYTYTPSTFQQAYAGINTYHQSLAALLQQYKSSTSVSSLLQSAAVAGYGSSTNIPGGKLNTPTTQTGTAIGYNDVMSSQYKDNSYLVSPQQSDNSATRVLGPDSRTHSGVPESKYYSFQQGQNQQAATFGQGQQPSQHYGALGYQNVYGSQAGMSPVNQLRQDPRDQSQNSYQGQAQRQQSGLIWQNGYY